MSSLTAGRLEGAKQAPSLPSAFGFALISVVMLLFLMTSLGLFLYLQTADQWMLSSAVDSQLHSLVLAENGIEYARTLLPSVKLDELLVGPDGVHAGSTAAEWRNPMRLKEARSMDPAAWLSPCDDGLPSVGGRLVLPKGYRSAEGGYFFLRFSNNPGEAPDHDQDHIVLARSMGVARAASLGQTDPSLKNDVTVVEAVLRQEGTFVLASALTLFGVGGVFWWEGHEFTVDGGEAAAVSLVRVEPSVLREDWLDSMQADQKGRIVGRGPSPSEQDAGPLYRQSRAYQVVWRPEFWRHFLGQLPDFADSGTEGVQYLPEGGAVSAARKGVVVARGDLTLSGDCRVEGLVLHLGGGSLTLEDRAEVQGGVWMSNFEVKNGEMSHLPLLLRVCDHAVIRYDSEAIEKAVAYFPPTQLGWRILFPEILARE
jgi:hypothetical protein